jgi:hypothetical protein
MSDSSEGFMSTEKAAIAWVVLLLSSSALILAWPVISPWLQEASAPAWVQAIGSIGAILVAVYVVREQNKAAFKLKSQTVRDHEIMMCVRALLACEGYLSALRAYKVHVLERATGPARHFKFAFGGTTEVLVPMDLDSLAFLAVREGMDALEVFSQINAGERQWAIYREGLVEFTKEAIDLPLRSLFEKTGKPLQPEEMVAAIGLPANTVLLERTADLERMTEIDSATVPTKILFLHKRIIEIYPGAVLPQRSATSAPEAAM